MAHTGGSWCPVSRFVGEQFGHTSLQWLLWIHGLCSWGDWSLPGAVYQLFWDAIIPTWDILMCTLYFGLEPLCYERVEKLLAHDSSYFFSSQIAVEQYGRNIELVMWTCLDIDGSICFAHQHFFAVASWRYPPTGEHHLSGSDDSDYCCASGDSKHWQTVLFGGHAPGNQVRNSKFQAISHPLQSYSQPDWNLCGCLLGDDSAFGVW